MTPEPFMTLSDAGADPGSGLTFLPEPPQSSAPAQAVAAAAGAAFARG